MIMRSMRRAVCGAIDSSGFTSASRLIPSGVSSNTQAKISAGMNPIASSDDDAARQPVRRAEHRQHRARDLREQPCADEVQTRHADDVAAFEFGEEAHALLTDVIAGRVLAAQIGRSVLVP